MLPSFTDGAWEESAVAVQSCAWSHGAGSISAAIRGAVCSLTDKWAAVKGFGLERDLGILGSLMFVAR